MQRTIALFLFGACLLAQSPPSATLATPVTTAAKTAPAAPKKEAAMRGVTEHNRLILTQMALQITNMVLSENQLASQIAEMRGRMRQAMTDISEESHCPGMINDQFMCPPDTGLDDKKAPAKPAEKVKQN